MLTMYLHKTMIEFLLSTFILAFVTVFLRKAKFVRFELPTPHATTAAGLI